MMDTGGSNATRTRGSRSALLFNLAGPRAALGLLCLHVLTASCFCQLAAAVQPAGGALWERPSAIGPTSVTAQIVARIKEEDLGGRYFSTALLLGSDTMEGILGGFKSDINLTVGRVPPRAPSRSC